MYIYTVYIWIASERKTKSNWYQITLNINDVENYVYNISSNFTNSNKYKYRNDNILKKSPAVPTHISLTVYEHMFAEIEQMHAHCTKARDTPPLALLYAVVCWR